MLFAQLESPSASLAQAAVTWGASDRAYGSSKILPAPPKRCISNASASLHHEHVQDELRKASFSPEVPADPQLNVYRANHTSEASRATNKVV